MDHPPKMDPSDELLSKTTDSDKYNVTATLEIASAYSTEKNTAQGDTNLQDIDDRSKTSSPVSRESLHLDLSGPATPERRDSSLTEDDMDPNTGLRRTDFLLPMSPMEKAVKFVENTELTYKVKKKDIPGGSSEPLSPEKIAISLELEQERNEIMGAMRVRKKRLDSWLDVKETPVDTAKWKSDSERRYEERKRQKEGKLPSPDRDDVIDVSQVPAPHWSAVIKDPNYYADADAKFATQTITTTSTTKEAWQGSTNQHPDHSSVSSNDSYQKHVVDDNSNIYTATVPTATVPTVTHHESTIEKEIRIARERENELKEERLRAQASPSVTMPIHKIPDPVVVDDYRRGPPLSPVPPASSPLPPQAAHASYRELPEADRDPAMTKRGESIIEREIREQLDREKSQREEGMYKAEIQQDKEAEQSEFERQEKEHERVAHESIVAREVREQREREQEVQYLRTTTTVTTVTSDPPPSPRVTSPLPPKQTVAMTTVAEEESVPRVQYEEAIQTKTHKGESFIERELREQREREEELHSRYKEMGLGEMLANQEPSDTPFNRPEPAQPDITKLPLHAKTTITGRRMTKSVSEPVHLSAGLPPPPRAQRASMVVTQEVTRTPEPPALAPAEPEPPRAMAREEVDGYDVSYRFVPQNETPIEREMRLSREREEELRLSRGIPNARRDDDDAVMELPSDLPKHESRATDVRHIQRFASSRLQHEIEKEKRREMDLKSQGMISTLSEERVSGPTKYVDVIPHEQNIKTIPNWKQPRPANFDAPDAKVTSPEPRNGVSPVPNAAAKKEPAVGKQYASHTRTLLDKDGDRYRSRATPNTAESRIEQELREMKDREEELRPYDDFDESVSLHRSISDYRVGFDNGDIKGSSPVPANGHEPELRAHSSSGDSVKASRRKSALAEEWEKKFGAN